MSPTPKRELFRRTIDSLEESVEANPDNPKFVQQLALAYFKAGYFTPRAVEIYHKASDLFQGDVKLMQAVQITMILDQGRSILQDIKAYEDLEMDKVQLIIDQLKKVQEHYSDSPEVLVSLSDVYLILGEYQEAVHHYKSALGLGFDDLGSICSHFEKVRTLIDVPTEVLSFFAEIYQRAGNLKASQDLYVSLMADGDTDSRTLDSFYHFLNRQIEQQEFSEDDYLEVISNLVNVCILRGKQSEAIRWAKEIPADSYAKVSPMLKRLSRVLIDIEDFRQAFDYLTKVPMDQEAKGMLNEIAVMLEQRAEIDSAAYVLQYINDNDQYIMRRKSGKDKLLEDDFDLGDDQVEEKDWELEITTELQLAELHWKSKRWERAFESYIRVLEMGYEDYRSIVEPLDSLLERLPDISERHLAFLASFFAERRDWQRTLFYSERALFLDPNLDDIRARMVQACEQILLQNPQAGEVRIKLGDLALEKSNIEKAIKCYRKAAAIPEFHMKASRRMAVALFRAGDLKTALQKFEEITILENEDLEHLYDLMISFQNTEQWKLCIKSAKLIRDYDVDFRDTEDKLRYYDERLSHSEGDSAVDPKMRELIGDHSIGRYRYIDKIGSGGMGVVHKVMDLKTNTVVAMKILREGLSGSDKAIDRFFREARIAATLHHPNIVNILDYNISNFYGQSYIAMEFVDGPSLRDILEDKFENTVEVEPEYIKDVILWIIQTCDALDATHHKGIIHRDIKPDNIMLAPESIIKLTDFGIVHIEEATFTPTGALIGTPRYMSPEQVHGGRIDARSDIYSVGIIMYEILIGSPPFISGDISYQQVNVIPANPREICTTIPEELDAVVMRCLEKNPADRYQTSIELKHALEEVFVQIGGDADYLQQRTSGEKLIRTKSRVPVQLSEKRKSSGKNETSMGTQADDGSVDSEMDLGSQFDDDRDRQDRFVRNPMKAEDRMGPEPVEPERFHQPGPGLPFSVEQGVGDVAKIDDHRVHEQTEDEIDLSDLDLDIDDTPGKNDTGKNIDSRVSSSRKKVAEIFDWDMDIQNPNDTGVQSEPPPPPKHRTPASPALQSANQNPIGSDSELDLSDLDGDFEESTPSRMSSDRVERIQFGSAVSGETEGDSLHDIDLDLD